MEARILRVRQVLTLMEQTLECPICLDIMKEPISTKCDHQFCRFCILELLEKSKGPALCPMCKETVTRRSLRENPMFKQIVVGVQRTMQAFQEDTGLQFTAAPGPPEVSVWGSPQSEPNRRARGSRRPRTLGQSRAGATSLSETVSSRPKRQRARPNHVELGLDSLSDDGEPWISALAAEDGLKSSSFRRPRAERGGDTRSDGARQRGEAPSAPPPLAGEWSRDSTGVAGDTNPKMEPSPGSAAPSGIAAAMVRKDDASSPAPATVSGEITEEVKIAAPPAKKSKRVSIRKVKEWLQKMDVAGEPKSASTDHVDGAVIDDNEGGGDGDMADGGGDGAADSISGGSERTTLLEDRSMEVSPVPVVVPLMELEKPLLTMNPGDRLFGKRYGRRHKLLPRARVQAAKRSRGALAPVCASTRVAVDGAGGSGGVVRVVATAGAPDDAITAEMGQVAASTRPPSTGKAVGKRRPRRSTEMSLEDFIRREPPSAVASTTGSVHAVREDGGMRVVKTRPKRRKLKNEASSHMKNEASPHQGNNGLPQEQGENNGVPLQQRENGFALQPDTDASPKQGGENSPSLPQDINTSPLQQAVNETPLQPQQQPQLLRKSASAQKRSAAKVHRYHSVGDGSKSRRRLELQVGGPSHVSWVPASIECFSSSEDALRNSPLQANKRRRSLGILGKDVRLADNDEGLARPRVTPPSAEVADDGAGGLHENRSVSPGQKLSRLCDHKCHGSPSVVPETPCSPASLLLVAGGAAGGGVVTAPALARRCVVCLERMPPGAVTAGSTVASPREAHRARHGTATTEPEHKLGSKDADCCGDEVSPIDTPDGLLVLPEEGAEQDGRVSEGGREHGGDCTGVMAVTLTPAETLVERRGGPEEASGSGSNGSVVENSQSLLHPQLERSGTEEGATGAGEALSLVDVSVASQMQQGLTRSVLNFQQEPTLNKSDSQLEPTEDKLDPQEVRMQDKLDTHQEITPYKLNRQQERTQDELCPQGDLTQYKLNTHQELTPPDLSVQQASMPDSLPQHQEPIATTLISQQESMGNDLDLQQLLNEAANFPREVKDVSKGVGSVEDGVVSMEDSEVDTQVALLSFLPSKRRSFLLVSPGASHQVGVHQSETHRTEEHQTSTHRGSGNQAETRGADEKQTISRHTGNNQTIIPPNGDNQTGDNQTIIRPNGDNQTGDNQTTIHQTGKHQIISLQTGDNQTITNPTGDNQTGDHQTICRHTGDHQTICHHTGDNQTINQQTDVNQTITHSASDNQTGDSQISTYQSGDNQTITRQIGDNPISTSQTSDKTSIHWTGHKQTNSHKPVDSQNNAHLASLPLLSTNEVVLHRADAHRTVTDAMCARWAEPPRRGNRLTKRTHAGRCARGSGSSWRSSSPSPGREATLRGGAGSGDESNDTLQLRHGTALPLPVPAGDAALSQSGTDGTPDIIMPTQRNTTDSRPGSLAARSHTSANTSSQEDSSGRPSISTMADSQPEKVIGNSPLLTCCQSDMVVGSGTGAGLGRRRSLIPCCEQPEVKVVDSSPSIAVDNSQSVAVISVSDLAVSAVSNSPHVATARGRKQRRRRRRIRVIVSSSSSDSDCEVELPSLGGMKVKWQQQGGMLGSPRDKGGPRTSPPIGSTLPASSPPLSQCSTASMDLFASQSEGSVWGRHGPSSPGDRDGAEGRAEVAEATGLTTSADRRQPLNCDPESGGEGNSAAEPRSRRDGILENESESTVIWASQDVDSEMKQELMRNLHEMGDEIAALEAALEDEDDCVPLPPSPPTPPSLCSRWKVGSRGQTAAQTTSHRDDGNGGCELAGALSRRVPVGAVDRGSGGHGGRGAASPSWEAERSDTLSDARCYVDTAASHGGASVTFSDVAHRAERLVDVGSTKESSGNPRRLCLVASGLSKRDALVVERFSHQAGGCFQSHFSPETTHVLMQTGGSLVCERTLKYFLGNAGHCWVLTFSWVEECLRQGCIVDEAPFEIQGDVVNGPDHLGPRRSRLATLKLLREFEICCYGAFKEMTKAELECLVQMSGAVLVKEPSAFSFHPNFVPLLVVQPDANPAGMDFTALHRLYSAQMVTREWVLDCIATHRVRRLNAYLLSPHTAPRQESP
ncbi:breast cancer type 1 susceptibility protein isoform X1 [Petromyzon marinus]|uniref:breast cancer type 1 susceptibility protein isoform X1 n=1 Tax=Petromyzon marinus TaxID=7757 RepID=UPI003F718C42